MALPRQQVAAEATCCIVCHPRSTHFRGHPGTRHGRSRAQAEAQELPLVVLELGRVVWALFLGWRVSYDLHG